MSIQTIKNGIKTNLDALVTSSVLGSAVITDIKRDPLAADFPAYPCAILMPPSTESEILDNRTLVRSYTFNVMIIVQAENLSSNTELEEMIEDVLDKFDNDPTLGGTANAGIPPTSSAPEPFQHNGRDLIMTIITITAKETIDLTFS